MRELRFVNRLLPNRAVRQPVIGLLEHIEYERTFTEANIAIAHFGRTVAPAAIAAKGATNEARISTWVNFAHRHIAAPHGKVVVHQEIRSRRIADLRQA